MTANRQTDKDTLSNPEALEAVTVRPFYDVTQKGVTYTGVKTENSEAVHQPPLWLSDAVYLIGRGVDTEGNHYRIIEWRDKISRQNMTGVLEMATIGTQQGWQRLQGMGITVLASRRKRELLADYLQTEGSNQVWQVANKAGWCGNAYILPSGEVLQAAAGKTHKATHVIYHGDTSQARCYCASGSLGEWQQHIARHMTGNSRLCLALGAAFAAPLMRLLDIEGGGFHLFGDSSDGKTTSAKVALSVWGKPDDLKLTWEGTGHGFANTANAKNDGLMILDEIGQAAPRVVSHTAYSVINGTGKVQGAKEGGNRELNRWRVMVLSTGEKTLEGYLKANKGDWQAGQANRLPSVPANAAKGHGIFDTLHGFADGAALAEHLNHAANQYHGTAGRAFIEALLRDTGQATQQAQEAMQAFQAALPMLSGQVRRVALRFALVAAALELAAQHGITGTAAGVGSMGVKQCFDDWLAREGTGKYEDRRIIEQATAFMQVHANSRFLRLPVDAIPHTMQNMAGYKELPGTDSEVATYYVIPATFIGEIANGFDTAKVCEVLHAANGWLQKPDGRWQKQKRINGEVQRFYVLLGTVPTDEE